MKTPILLGKKKKVRILRPAEVAEMRKYMKIEDRTLFDGCLLMGCRYEEGRRIQNHPEWYDGVQFIAIEEHKTERIQKQRFIRLSSKGRMIMDYFFAGKKLPCVQNWDIKLKRWAALAGLGDMGITARSLRKTYESWLVLSYPSATAIIYGSQGHNELTSLQFYINMPFTEDEKREMKEWVDGYI